MRNLLANKGVPEMNSPKRKTWKLKVFVFVLFALLLTGVILEGRFIKDNWDVISLKRNRPEMVEALQKVLAGEDNILKANEITVKENSVKQILSPLVVDEASK